LNRRALALLATLAACDPLTAPTPVSSDDVLKLSDCPSGLLCTKIADGASTVAVEVCALAPDPRADGSVNLTLSAGRWITVSDPAKTISASLKADACFRPSFVTPSDTTSVHIEAEYLGFRASKDLILAPASVASVEIVPQVLPLKTNQLASVNVTARANVGTVTKGTTIAFSADAASGAIFFPAHAVIDSGNSTMVAVLVTNSVSETTITATASPPPNNADASEATAVVTLPVTAP